VIPKKSTEKLRHKIKIIKSLLSVAVFRCKSTSEKTTHPQKSRENTDQKATKRQQHKQAGLMPHEELLIRDPQQRN
jgi:hypothetical protein